MRMRHAINFNKFAFARLTLERVKLTIFDLNFKRPTYPCQSRVGHAMNVAAGKTPFIGFQFLLRAFPVQLAFHKVIVYFSLCLYNRRFITLNGLKWCVRWNSVRLVLPDSYHCCRIGGTLLMTSPKRRLSMKCAQSTVIYPRDTRCTVWRLRPHSIRFLIGNVVVVVVPQCLLELNSTKYSRKKIKIDLLLCCTLTFAMISRTMLLLVVGICTKCVHSDQWLAAIQLIMHVMSIRSLFILYFIIIMVSLQLAAHRRQIALAKWFFFRVHCHRIVLLFCRACSVSRSFDTNTNG